MKYLNKLSEFGNTQISDILLLANARTVRKLRKIKNITQGEAALIADISQSYLSNVEHAKHMLSIHKLVCLTVAMDFHPQDCFDILVHEMSYTESIYRSFKENREKYNEYSNFREFVKDNIEICISY